MHLIEDLCFILDTIKCRKNKSMLTETHPVVNKHSWLFDIGYCVQMSEDRGQKTETLQRLLPLAGSGFKHFYEGFDAGSQLAFGKIAGVHTIHFQVQNRHVDFFESFTDQAPGARALAAAPVAGIDGTVQFIVPGQFLEVMDSALHVDV